MALSGSSVICGPGDWACSSETGLFVFADTGDMFSTLNGNSSFEALGLGLDLGGDAAAVTAPSSSGLPDSKLLAMPDAAFRALACCDCRQNNHAERPISASPPITPTTAPTMTPVFEERPD